MPYDMESEDWHAEREAREDEARRAENKEEEEDLDYDIENPDEDEPVNKIGRF